MRMLEANCKLPNEKNSMILLPQLLWSSTRALYAHDSSPLLTLKQKWCPKKQFNRKLKYPRVLYSVRHMPRYWRIICKVNGLFESFHQTVSRLSGSLSPNISSPSSTFTIALDKGVIMCEVMDAVKPPSPGLCCRCACMVIQLPTSS